MRATIARRSALFGFFLFAALVVSAMISLCLGAAPISIGDVWRALTHQPVEASTNAIVWQLRLPRVVLGALVGAMLALAGAGFQGLFRNPLADPYIVGVASGAAVGGAIATLFHLNQLFGGFGVPIIALVFALAGLALVYAVGRRQGSVQIGSLLLGGVAVGSALWALITLILIVARQDLNTVLYWLMGSLADRSWAHVTIALPFFLIGWLGLQGCAQGLDVFSLGEESAAHLGVEVERLKTVALLAGSLLTAAAVSACGLIGFVGLVVPHVARGVVGPSHRRMLPIAALLGALLLIWADVAARMALNPTELPVGVITALLGAPFFVAVIRKM